MATKKNSLTVSYLILRQIIGLLGILLPLLCVIGGAMFGGFGVEGSISAYYWTNMRDVFVGLLVCVGLFMATYRGYDLQDRIVSAILAVTAVGIAFNPCFNAPDINVGVFNLPPKVSNIIHGASAAIFFLLLAYNSYFLFTKTGKTTPTPQKLARNKIYRVCGIVIFACCVVVGLCMLLMSSATQEATKVILVFESIMLLAFGISWLTKGRAIIKDPEVAKEEKHQILANTSSKK